MTEYSLADYKILILDEKPEPSSWGEVTKKSLEAAGFKAVHFLSVPDALTEIGREYYDLLVVDMDLGGRIDGMEFQRRIRDLGLFQPVLFVTGNDRFLETPIFQYSDTFRRGPVLFFDKTSDVDFMEVIREAINRVDPIRRSLYLMKKAGLGDEEFTVGDQIFTVDQLLLPNSNTNSLVRSLRESLQELVLEMFRSGDATRCDS
jgi:DNA-binding NtrC family response regulator